MDEVITRILEVEKQCETGVKKAEAEYPRKIEKYKRILEEKRATKRAGIEAEEKTKLDQAIDKAKKQIEIDSAALRQDIERRLQDPALSKAVKENIISILLES